MAPSPPPAPGCSSSSAATTTATTTAQQPKVVVLALPDNGSLLDKRRRQQQQQTTKKKRKKQAVVHKKRRRSSSSAFYTHVIHMCSCCCCDDDDGDDDDDDDEDGRAGDDTDDENDEDDEEEGGAIPKRSYWRQLKACLVCEEPYENGPGRANPKYRCFYDAFHVLPITRWIVLWHIVLAAILLTLALPRSLVVTPFVLAVLGSAIAGLIRQRQRLLFPLEVYLYFWLLLFVAFGAYLFFFSVFYKGQSDPTFNLELERHSAFIHLANVLAALVHLWQLPVVKATRSFFADQQRGFPVLASDYSGISPMMPGAM